MRAGAVLLPALALLLLAQLLMPRLLLLLLLRSCLPLGFQLLAGGVGSGAGMVDGAVLLRPCAKCRMVKSQLHWCRPPCPFPRSVLGMVDGAVLLVDANEGPLSQTKFVVEKAIKRGLR